MHPAALPTNVLLAQCRETHTRRGGPGGQHRNKVETAVLLVHAPTGLSAEAAERRSQAENRAVAIGRLRLRLALEHRLPADREPSALLRSRTRNGRLVVAATHADFPAILAEALDHLAAVRFEVRPAAEALGISPTQLVRLFARCPAAWTLLSRRREALGLRPLT